MSKRCFFVSDFSANEISHGGAELEDEILRSSIGADFIKSEHIKTFDPNNFYVISNISRIKPTLLQELYKCQYIILEHDYKFCHSRWPWAYKDNIVPESEKIRLDIYSKAQMTFVQSTDHLNIFKKNNILGNFFNLTCGLWSNEELDIMRKILESGVDKINKTVIYESSNWIKNTTGASQYCNANGIQYDLIKNCPSREQFLTNLSKYSQIVFFPLARETLCRLVVESRCLGVKVLTKGEYGAILEDWFTQFSKTTLIDFLEKKSKENIETIKRYAS